MGNRRKRILVSALFGFGVLGLSLLIAMTGTSAMAGEVGADVERLLRDIRQDQPVPAVPEHPVPPPVPVGSI